ARVRINRDERAGRRIEALERGIGDKAVDHRWAKRLVAREVRDRLVLREEPRRCGSLRRRGEEESRQEGNGERETERRAHQEAPSYHLPLEIARRSPGRRGAVIPPNMAV